MNDLKTYDPKDITVIVSGRRLTGFSEDQVVSVERETNTWEDAAGADGEVVRWATNDRRGTITVNLQPTSESNLFLSTLLNADELTGSVLFPVVVKDLRGNDLHVAAQAWIQKFPRAVYRKGVEGREWAIRTGDLRMVVAGS